MRKAALVALVFFLTAGPARAQDVYNGFFGVTVAYGDAIEDVYVSGFYAGSAPVIGIEDPITLVCSQTTPNGDGSFQVHFNAAGAAAGVYEVRLFGDEGAYTVQVPVLHPADVQTITVQGVEIKVGALEEAEPFAVCHVKGGCNLPDLDITWSQMMQAALTALGRETKDWARETIRNTADQPTTQAAVTSGAACTASWWTGVGGATFCPVAAAAGTVAVSGAVMNGIKNAAKKMVDLAWSDETTRQEAYLAIDGAAFVYGLATLDPKNGLEATAVVADTAYDNIQLIEAVGELERGGGTSGSGLAAQADDLTGLVLVGWAEDGKAYVISLAKPDSREDCNTEKITEYYISVHHISTGGGPGTGVIASGATFLGVYDGQYEGYPSWDMTHENEATVTVSGNMIRIAAPASWSEFGSLTEGSTVYVKAFAHQTNGTGHWDCSCPGAGTSYDGTGNTNATPSWDMVDITKGTVRRDGDNWVFEIYILGEAGAGLPFNVKEANWFDWQFYVGWNVTGDLVYPTAAGAEPVMVETGFGKRLIMR